jgi:hypothetical protein
MIQGGDFINVGHWCVNKSAYLGWWNWNDVDLWSKILWRELWFDSHGSRNLIDGEVS